MSMQEAVGRFVPDGASVCMGTALEALISFAVGCVRRIQAAWVRNVSAGLGHNYQRAVEHGVLHRIEVEDHSNLRIAVALQAGAMGAPYIPARSGTGLLDSSEDAAPLRTSRLRSLSP
jgi:glutaconate CoA-transferase subunit A